MDYKRKAKYIFVGVNALYIAWGLYHVAPSFWDIYEVERDNGFFIRIVFYWLTLSGVFVVLGSLVMTGMGRLNRKKGLYLGVFSLVLPVLALGLASFVYDFPGGFYIVLLTYVSAIIWKMKKDIKEVYVLFQERKHKKSKREK
ncbi:hypothetical protein ABEV55_14725 [Aneurinibacillus thermoaerophilus]|uniref:hypothetical protein n=1 Tax=Aneurinibacillus thermoaerophilus TaxID=143495 RepID=UPI002E2423AD|nr:hypothetical protein [Aneurinibacillus thermoaerophilus]